MSPHVMSPAKIRGTVSWYGDFLPGNFPGFEINHAMLVYSVGRDLGDELCRIGQKDQGIEMLKRSLAIGKAAGFPDVGQVEEMLRRVGG
jgi:hypothetical protein